jgi:hypothetical protein
MTAARHYIGVTPLGRLHLTVTPGPSGFATRPTEPVTLPGGNVLYPVSAEVAAEWDADPDVDLDDVPEDQSSVASVGGGWHPGHPTGQVPGAPQGVTYRNPGTPDEETRR